MNGEVFVKRVESGPKPNASSVNSLLMILLRSSGEQLQIFCTTRQLLCCWLCSLPQSSILFTSRFECFSATSIIWHLICLGRAYCGWNLTIPSLSCALRGFFYVPCLPSESFFSTLMTRGNAGSPHNSAVSEQSYFLILKARRENGPACLAPPRDNYN